MSRPKILRIAFVNLVCYIGNKIPCILSEMQCHSHVIFKRHLIYKFELIKLVCFQNSRRNLLGKKQYRENKTIQPQYKDSTKKLVSLSNNNYRIIIYKKLLQFKIYSQPFQNRILSPFKTNI